ARSRRGLCWMPSGHALQSVVSNYIQRRPRSSTAGMMTAGERTRISSSTSSGTPSTLDERRTGGENSSSVSSRPSDRVTYLINPVLRGWVNYFAVGNSGECFSFIQDWVEKVRRHMMKARKRQGFGWTRWSRQSLYETLKLFNGYNRWPQPKVAPAR